MRRQPLFRGTFSAAMALGIVGACAILVGAQRATTSQPIVVRAGRLFHAKSGTNRADQVVVINGDKIVDVGPAGTIAIPAGAKTIDLSQATVLPGLIDGHVHLTDGRGDQRRQALASALEDLKAGYTTLVTQGSHGGLYTDIALKREIDSGRIQGPRLMPAGPILGQELPAKGPDAFRVGLRELSQHGADHVKIMTTGAYSFKPDGQMVNVPTITREEMLAAVDEAHRLGMYVATHSYGGDGLKWAIEAGVDDIQHAVAADDADIRLLKQKNLPITATILDLRQDEPGDLQKFAPYSKWRLAQVTWRKMLATGIRLGFGSGAASVTDGEGRIFNTACQCSHGVQGEMFPIFVQWGATPASTLQMATTVNAEIIHQQNTLGTIEKGKYADLVAVAGDPLQNIGEMQHVKFVMKGGAVIRDDLTASGQASR